VAVRLLDEYGLGLTSHTGYYNVWLERFENPEYTQEGPIYIFKDCEVREHRLMQDSKYKAVGRHIMFQWRRRTTDNVSSIYVSSQKTRIRIASTDINPHESD